LKDSSQPFNPSNEASVRGWILDLYTEKTGEMAVWIKTEKGQCLKIVDKWKPYFYVSAPTEEDLLKLTWHLPKNEVAAECEFAEKFVGLQDSERTKVLRITVPDAASLRFLTGIVWRLGDYEKYRLWNVDTPLPQMYLYEKDLFPFALVEAKAEKGNVSWKLMDSTESVDYRIPRLRTVKLRAKIASEGAVPTFEDQIAELLVEADGEQATINSSDEGEKILALVKTVRELDPDIVLSEGGDTFLFTYLARRALKNGVLRELELGREKAGIEVVQKKGTTYFSYGRVYYRAAPQRLLGRLHIDLENSGFYARYGLEGLVEIARTCRIPLHSASRVTIGTSMKSVQLYQAHKDDVLVPWKKSEPENFKTARDLLTADRGGFYFEPKLGIHDNVGEIDFSSMYPTLMLKNNISPETIGCECCPDSGNRVPELGYNICEKRVGIIPKVLDLMLKKRAYYKTMRDKTSSPEEKKKFDQRQAAYKIILCTCFGYMGYRNARFGKVDAFNAACAFARKTLLDTAQLAEQRGFEIVYGIVDSLYLKKEDATDKDFTELCREITEKTGLSISYEGRYRWIVFLPSKTHLGVPVLNRFYGVFNDGKIKARGIELRRGDTPSVVSRCQDEIIRELAKARNSEEFVQRISEAFNVYRKYANKILNKEVGLEDLALSKRISKNPDEYAGNVQQAVAARQLQRRGLDIAAGQIVKYVILDADNRRPERRVVAAQLTNENVRYDTERYLALLDDALHNILSPFLAEGEAPCQLKPVLHVER
jgi:DNA polymerase elongation subunit (family B)